METSVAQGDDQGSCFPKCLGFPVSIEFNRCQWWISQVWPQFLTVSSCFIIPPPRMDSEGGRRISSILAVLFASQPDMLTFSGVEAARSIKQLQLLFMFS